MSRVRVRVRVTCAARDGSSATPRVSRAYGHACNNAERYLARIFMLFAILRAGGDTRAYTYAGVIGVETISSSLPARKIALEDADVQAEIQVKVIGLMRDFYCWMMEEPE